MLKDPLILHYLRTPILVCVLAAGAIGAAISLLNYQQTKTVQQMVADEAELNNLIQQIRFLQYQATLYESYGDKYYQLINQGLANTQDRVKWTDALLLMKQQMVINPFSFQFEAQQPIESNQILTLKMTQPIFYVTNLNIKMTLHSDYDLFIFFEEFSRKITPLFLVNRCRIVSSVERMKQLEFDPVEGIIEASCVLSLFESKPRLFQGGE